MLLRNTVPDFGTVTLLLSHTRHFYVKSYQLSWSVDSYSPIEENRLLYRKIKPYHGVSLPFSSLCNFLPVSVLSEQFSFRKSFANSLQIDLSQTYLLIFRSWIDSYSYSPEFNFMNIISICKYNNLMNNIPIHEYFSKYSWISYFNIEYIYTIWIYLSLDLFGR